MSNPPRTGSALETLVRDIGHEIADTAKQTVKESVRAVSPTEFLKAIYGISEENPARPEIPEGANHTPLNIEKTQAKHAATKRDEQELAALRQQYFAHVNQESQQARHAIDQEQEQLQQQRMSEDATLHAQHQHAMSQQAASEPAGKERKSILGGKPKKSAGMHVPNNAYETRSNKGK